MGDHLSWHVGDWSWRQQLQLRPLNASALLPSSIWQNYHFDWKQTKKLWSMWNKNLVPSGGKFYLQNTSALTYYPCWLQPLALSLICYYTSATTLSVTLKYQLLIPDLLLLLSTWCNLHFLIDRTITAKDIFQISLIFFHSQISTPPLKCYKISEYLKVHRGAWVWREAVVFQHALIFLFVLSFRVTQGLLFPLLGGSFSFQLKKLIWVVLYKSSQMKYP